MKITILVSNATEVTIDVEKLNDKVAIQINESEQISMDKFKELLSQLLVETVQKSDSTILS